MIKNILLVLSMLIILPLYAALRDPTRPETLTTTSPVTATVFDLSAIIYSNERKIAVINGLRKRVGDEILGSKIIAIKESTVQLDGPSGKITLFLVDKSVKHLSTYGSS
jgi:hypothetical protein